MSDAISYVQQLTILRPRSRLRTKLWEARPQNNQQFL